MNVSELLPLLNRLGVKPSRKLGQNFLIDGNTLRVIVQAAAPAPERLVVEIGPGTGVLTRELLAAGVQLVAIEFDARLADYLRTELVPQQPALTLVQADACRVDFDALTAGRSWDCIANLPYAVSTVILTRLLSAANRPRRLTILLQLEMAERLAASANSKDYGALTVRTQALYDVHLVRRIHPTVFYPPPAIESALVTLSPTASFAPPADWQSFNDFVRHAFTQRRKMLPKILRGVYPADRIAAAFAELGFSLESRPDTLTVAQYLALHAHITAK